MAESRAVSGGQSRAVQPGTEEIDYIPAQPLRPLEHPQYPERLLSTGPASFTLSVVITIDGDGGVSSVERSWKDSLHVGTTYADDFLESVRATVSRWTLQGARQVYWVRTEAGEREYLRTEKVSERVEMKFTFEKLNGRK